MENFVLDNRKKMEQLAAGTFGGSISHEFRKQFMVELYKYAPNQHVEWNCSCNSVQRAAKIIMRNYQ